MDETSLTDAERQAVQEDGHRTVPGWQFKNRDALHDVDGVFLPGGNLRELIDDYLDRFGELSQCFTELQFGHADGETAPWIRQQLQRHLLAITLLLERCDGLEYHRTNAEWLAENPRSA